MYRTLHDTMPVQKKKFRVGHKKYHLVLSAAATNFEGFSHVKRPNKGQFQRQFWNWFTRIFCETWPTNLGPWPNCWGGSGLRDPTGARGTTTPIFGQFLAQFCQITWTCSKPCFGVLNLYLLVSWTQYAYKFCQNWIKIIWVMNKILYAPQISYFSAIFQYFCMKLSESL